MSNEWSVEEVQTKKVRPTALFDDLKALAGRWQSDPFGQFLGHAGMFESQVDAEDLLARLNSVRNPDSAEEVLAAAINFAQLGRVVRPADLKKVLLPYQQKTGPSLFMGRDPTKVDF